jgi:glutamine amidotransferase
VIGIVDYGLGNIQAFANIYKRNNLEAKVVSTADALRESDRLILPGVGSFDWAMSRLNASGLRETLDEVVVAEGRPILGVCVGMQMMGDSSDEGDANGLGWIGGHVKKFAHEDFDQATHLPHMGWNDVAPREGEPLFDQLESEARFYFLHSYYFRPENVEHSIATTDYAGEYASSIRSRNVYGVQFHPEKSHQWGIRLLMNFAKA